MALGSFRPSSCAPTHRVALGSTARPALWTWGEPQRQPLPWRHPTPCVAVASSARGLPEVLAQLSYCRVYPSTKAGIDITLRIWCAQHAMAEAPETTCGWRSH